MASYQFLSPEGETALLNDVDKRICDDMGVETSETDY